MNRKNYEEERVITIKGILRLLKAWWKYALLVVLAGTLVWGGRGVIKQYQKVKAQADMPDTKEKKISVDEAEYYNVKSCADYEDIIKEKQEYIDHSILMRVDPMHKLTGTLSYTFAFADGEAHDAAALAASYRDELLRPESMQLLQQLAETDADISYLGEIMTADASSAPGMYVLTFTHYDAEQLGRLLDAAEQFYRERPTLGIEIGGAYTASVTRMQPAEMLDGQLANTQTAVKAELAGYQSALASMYGQLTDKELSYLELYRDARGEEGYEEGQTLVKTEAVKKAGANYLKVFVVNAAKGFAGALALCLAAALLAYIFSPVLLSADSLTDMYGITVFAHAKKAGQMDELCDMAAAILKGGRHEGGIALVSTDRAIMECESAKQLLQGLEESKLSVTLACEIDRNASELAMLSEADEAYLLEAVGKSRHKRLSRQLILCDELGLKVGGAFLVR